MSGFWTYGASFNVLYSFPSNAAPSSALVQAADGALYGTTLYDGPTGDGSVFRITTNGVFTNLHLFNYLDGSHPFDALTVGPDGAFYGTTATGGPGYYGTVFRLTTNGTFTTIAFFSNTNGAGPRALVLAQDGFFYGATTGGGPKDFGTVFRVGTDGSGLTNLVFFVGTNGQGPLRGVIEGSDGCLYGTTTWGGSNTNGDPKGNGTVFKLTTNGLFTTLVSFDGTNGGHPFDSLLEGRDGKFYGTTEDGGAMNSGTVFEVAGTGVMKTLFSFAPLMLGYPESGGVYPEGGLIRGKDGALYGTTAQGGFSSGRFGGTVFRITTNGLFSAIYSFAGANGGWPTAKLTVGSDGAFYGTCKYGGINQGGTIFRLDPTVQMFAPQRVVYGIHLSFSGLPASVYGLQWALDADGPWMPYATVTADTNGIGEWDDFSNLQAKTFYRVIIP